MSKYLQNEELHNLQASANACCIHVKKSRRMRWARQVARMVEMRNAYKIWVGKPEAKKPLGKRRHRGENNME
jgi:hypothetical protein